MVLVFGSYLQLNTSRASLKILKGPHPAVGRVGPRFAMKFSFLRRGPQSPPLRQNCLDWKYYYKLMAFTLDFTKYNSAKSEILFLLTWHTIKQIHHEYTHAKYNSILMISEQLTSIWKVTIVKRNWKFELTLLEAVEIQCQGRSEGPPQ